MFQLEQDGEAGKVYFRLYLHKSLNSYSILPLPHSDGSLKYLGTGVWGNLIQTKVLMLVNQPSPKLAF